ncbi:MAG: hypothetical protein EU547_05570 [Promethearchaeota archaeon]|nr:MAG: hypothetical protein EU547_05570 [Candidatus Lokiarchaeota archaeon]
MTIKQSGFNNTGNLEDLVCEECKSTNIIKTGDGYVCTQCGLVLDLKRMEYHRPYKQNRIQHSAIHNTTLGTKAERNNNMRSGHLNRLSKIHTTQSKSKNSMVYSKARMEIRRILSGLDLPSSFENPIFKKFEQIFNNIKKCTKFRAPRKILPAIIFYYCREKNISLQSKDFIQICKVSADEFRRARILYLKIFQDYFARNRVKLIKSYVSDIKESLNLDYEFYENSLRMAQYFWDDIYQTSDKVIAGLVSSLAVLCNYSYYNELVSISDICRIVNIRPSTINAQISKTIVEKLEIVGFESPVKSSDLIKIYLHKFEILPEKQKVLKEETPEMIEEKSVNDWESFSAELMEIFSLLQNQSENIPSHIYSIENSTEKAMPEIHIFQFPNYDCNKNKFLILKIASIPDQKQRSEHFGFATQKGPPWDEEVMIFNG